ncbi:hypothetical protein T265_03952 [Opisthorchis viverrini]|uniref:Small ribosomal subunit protein uS9 n=1 Tax=Opisthorchis viverrini TaxID=6198 RepID=A0A074ZPN0_OPIVI|nr:hypothetical protein T265_03952 [Opisthorchis viverrini]KER29378.1 hypothetical protein T265_03952 [Opisthorchis viverrini]
MIRRTFSRIARMDFQVLYGAYVRPLLEYANQVVYSGRTKDVILIERVQRAATRMVAGLKSVDYETRLAMLDLFPLEYRRLRGDLILTYALFEQSLANRFFTVDPANTRRGHSIIRVNGRPIEALEPKPLLPKLLEPILLIGRDRFACLDIRVRVSGGGRVAQIYAIRQALAKSVVAFHQKYVDETSKNIMKEKLVQYDRSLLVADPRRCEPKKFGGPGARARYQKSYR